MTIKKALGFSKSLFPKPDPRDLELLLSHSLNQSKEYLLTHDDKKISWAIFLKFLYAAWKRRLGWPLAYMLGYREFYGRKFLITPDVLIPRPETEILIETALKTIHKLQSINSSSSPGNDIKTVIDVGTGSGCIAITLAKEAPQLQLIACDISTKALKVAQKNAQLHAVKIQFIKSNLLQSVQIANNTMLVANLPYLRPQDISAEIKFEPRCALISGLDGLKHYKALLEQINSLPVKPRVILLEVHPPTLGDLVQFVKNLLTQAKLETLTDLSGKPRVLLIWP